MADQASTLTSNATSTTTATALPLPLTNILPAQLTSTLQSLAAKAQSLVPASTVTNIKTKLASFASKHPLLASFIFSQVVISGLPLALFAIIAITVFVFGILAGVLVGVLGALVFAVLAVGFALLVLLPTLFVAVAFAVTVWGWGWGFYYVVKWVGTGSGGEEGDGLGILKREAVNGKGAKSERRHEHEDEMVHRGERNGTGEKAGQEHELTKSSQHWKKARNGNATQTEVPVQTPNSAGKPVASIGKDVTNALS